MFKQKCALLFVTISYYAPKQGSSLALFDVMHYVILSCNGGIQDNTLGWPAWPQELPLHLTASFNIARLLNPSTFVLCLSSELSFKLGKNCSFFPLSRPFNAYLSYWIELKKKKHVFLWSGPSGQNTKSWQISSPLSRTWFSKEHLLHLPMPPSGIHYSWRTTFNLHFEEVLYKYVIYCLCGCRKHKIYVMIIWYDCWYGNRRRSEGWMPTGWTIRPFPMPLSEINLNTIHIRRTGLK